MAMPVVNHITNIRLRTMPRYRCARMSDFRNQRIVPPNFSQSLPVHRSQTLNIFPSTQLTILNAPCAVLEESNGRSTRLTHDNANISLPLQSNSSRRLVERALGHAPCRAKHRFWNQGWVTSHRHIRRRRAGIRCDELQLRYTTVYLRTHIRSGLALPPHTRRRCTLQTVALRLIPFWFYFVSWNDECNCLGLPDAH